MKEIFVMLCGGYLLDKCLASSVSEASDMFKERNRYEDWSESDIMSEADYLNELEFNKLENQSNEC
jgi:hypothetical protein